MAASVSEPFEIHEDYLFAKIGRLMIENELLRAQLAQQPQPDAGREPPAPDEPKGES